MTTECVQSEPVLCEYEYLQKYPSEVWNIFGVRVVYFNPTLKSDHSDKHNTAWDAAINEDCLEAGTITKVDTDHKEHTATATVCWDCGVVKTYTPDQWLYLRVYNLGPAGYLGQMVFCDKCLEPSKGLAFRLARENKSVGDLYDLCHKCYNECDDEHVNSPFYCNIPSGNIDQEDSERTRTPKPPRNSSQKLFVVGIFKCAIVEIESTDTVPTQGEVLNTVHEKGNYDLRKAKFYDSCAEIKIDATASGSGKPELKYKEAGSGGKVELKAIKPGKAPSPMPVEHYPTLGIEIIKEMLTYKKKLIKINEGEWDCFMRFKDELCYSLTISGTRLTRITDSKIWKRCQNLRIVILLMNELNDLPQELCEFVDSIELVCIQHNRFTKVPPILFQLKHIKHLNLHGNQISEFPNEMEILVNLERLKFGHNRLYSLPDIFSNFKLLTEITFNNNFLTRLPPSFAELEQLESIDLRDNSFTCVPAPLLKLPKLKVLYLDWNRIQRLAPLEDCDGKDTFELLRRLVSLRLAGNPVYEQLRLYGSDLLKLVTKPGIYYELHKVPILRALRVLVLGSCGAGKTSIVEALSFNKYVTPTSELHHDHTVGINRFSIPVRMKRRDKTYVVTELRLWDFAGERSYVMMNNLFVTDGTLIWIAVNFETYKCTDKSFHENIASWLQQVMTKAVRPIIWIVGTHTDKCSKGEADKKVQHIKDSIKSRCKVYQKELIKELDRLTLIKQKGEYKHRSKECVHQNIEVLTKLTSRNVPCFVADNLKVIYLTNDHTFSGHENLKYHIEHLLINSSDSFGHLTDELTDSEQRATDKLRQKTEELLANKKVPVVDSTDVLDIVKSELGSDSESKKLLQYLYQTGSLLVCELHSEIILDVDWLIGLLAQVFHHDFPAMIDEKKAGFSLTSDTIEHAVTTQQKIGIVVKPLLEALWSDSLTLRFLNHFIELLNIYGLAFETAEDPPGCLFPWLVKNNCPNPDLPSVHNQRKQITVSYEFSPCLPPCFLQQLVVKCKKHYTIKVVYMDAFVVYASKRLPQTDNSFTILSVYIFVLPEPNKLCGKIILSACTQQDIDISAHPALVSDLWEMLMIVVKEMEHLLCNWRFYGSLQRKVCCPQCLKPGWDLQLYNWTQQAGLEPVFECNYCSRIILPNHGHPPLKFQLSKPVSNPVDFFWDSNTQILHSASLPQFRPSVQHFDSTATLGSYSHDSSNDSLPAQKVGAQFADDQPPTAHGPLTAIVKPAQDTHDLEPQSDNDQ